MTGDDVISNRARHILADVYADGDPSQRWGDTILMAWLNEGTRIIAEKRPESLLTAPYAQSAYADISTIGATVIIPDKYRDALVDYVCAKALSQDAQDERDLARSKYHYDQFVAKAGITEVMGGRSA